jgi:dihydrofolate reductase
MRKIMVVMFTTLDGIAEFPEYPDDKSPPEDPMWEPRMDSIDTIILGRRSYEAWFQYWPQQKDKPSSSEWAKNFSRFCDRCTKVVFSKTLQEAKWPNSVIARGDVEEEVARLKAIPGKDIALGGGPRLLQSFLEHDLADELVLDLFPSILGSGKPLFRVKADPDHAEDFIPKGTPGRHDFRLLEAKPLADGSLFLRYERASGGDHP